MESALSPFTSCSLSDLLEIDPFDREKKQLVRDTFLERLPAQNVASRDQGDVGRERSPVRGIGPRVLLGTHDFVSPGQRVTLIIAY